MKEAIMDLRTAEAARSIIAATRAQLDRLEALFTASKEEELDPKDPRNKADRNLTERGVEVCYRLFDQGKTIYAVKEAMGMSYGAAKYRHETWLKAGAANRTPQPL
jgi:hypothetical protein